MANYRISELDFDEIKINLKQFLTNYRDKENNLIFKDYIKNFETVRNSFHPSNQNFWATMSKWYNNLEFFDIYGGEPFLIDGLWQGLQTAIDQQASQHIALQLHTNLSIWNDSYLEILKKFKKVNIIFYRILITW